MNTAAKRLRLASRVAAAHRVWLELDLVQCAADVEAPDLIEATVIADLALLHLVNGVQQLADDIHDDDPDDDFVELEAASA